MASMMDEMAKTLARRRAQAEGGDKGSTKSTVLNGSSPSKDTADCGSRTRNSVDPSSTVNGHLDGQELERLLDRVKQDILAEMKKELLKTKNEIIDAIRMELNRRGLP